MLAVWLAVTASAVTVAWFGIDSVVGAQTDASTQLLTPVDPSGAQLAAGSRANAEGAPPVHPTPTKPPAAVRTPAKPSPSPTAATTSAPPPHTAPPTTGQSPDGGQLRRFSMTGGSVVVQMQGDDVTFVSATPTSGYQMQDWIESPQEWLRVDFTEASDNSDEYSFFITWNGYSPQWTEAGPGWTHNGS
jgi:hypothetical protein